MGEVTDASERASALVDRLADVIYRRLATDWCGNSHPPGDHWRKHFGPDSYPELAVWNNDGFELWIGMGHEWHTHMPRSQARRLAWFIVQSDIAIWFGLRRKVWYWALGRRVRKYRTPRARPAVSSTSPAPEVRRG